MRPSSTGSRTRRSPRESRRTPSRTPWYRVWASTFLHGFLAGIVFVLVLPLFPAEIPLWVLGPGYGVILFAITLVIHKPITGRAPWSGSLGPVALGVSLLAHVVYGAALALLVVWP